MEPFASRRYICRERFPQDYFNLDCHGPTKDQELAEISSCFSTVQCMKIWGGRCKMGTCIARAIYDRRCIARSFGGCRLWSLLVLSGNVASWYTICGQRHARFGPWLGGLIIISISGAYCPLCDGARMVCVCVCTSLAHEIRGSQPFDLLKHVCTCLPK